MKKFKKTGKAIDRFAAATLYGYFYDVRDNYTKNIRAKK